MSRFSEGSDRNPSVRPDGDPSDGGVFQGDPEPSFRRQLKSATNKISNDVGVAHNELVAVLRLLGASPVEILPEGAFDSGTVNMILHLRPL